MTGKHINKPAHGTEDERATLRVETDDCLDEIEWYATRRTNLASDSGNRGTVGPLWADVMLADIEDLRKALAAERNAR